MQYIEMTVEEAKKRCRKNAKILVAIQDLKDDNVDMSSCKREEMNPKLPINYTHNLV